MDGISAAASILAIAAAGFQVSVKLAVFSRRITGAASEVQRVGNDVSLTASLIHQLGELMEENHGDGSKAGLFSKEAISTIRSSAESCENIFKELLEILKKASKQIRKTEYPLGRKVELSPYERFRWPFREPHIQPLQAELSSSRERMMLILQVVNLACCKKLMKQYDSVLIDSL